MAYREVRMMDIEQVMRQWLAGESIRAIARSTGLARNTVKRVVKLASEGGIKPGDGWPEEPKLRAVRGGIGRPGGPECGEAEQILLDRKDFLCFGANCRVPGASAHRRLT